MYLTDFPKAFFQGKYIDHSLTNRSLGLAELNLSSIVTRNASTTSPPTTSKSTATSGGNSNKMGIVMLSGFVAFAMALWEVIA